MAKGQPTIDDSDYNPQGRSIADAAAYQILTGQAINIPTSENLDSDEAQTVPNANGRVPLPYPASSFTWDSFDHETFTNGAELTTEFEVHKFLVIPATPEASGARLEDENVATAETEEAEEGQTEEVDPSTTRTPLQLNVPVILSDDGPRLAALPSFGPWEAASEQQAGISDYSDYNKSSGTVDVPSQVSSQISRWAKAYATDDRETLLSVTGDTNAEHTYIGLGNFTIPTEGSQVKIMSATSGGADALILRVRVAMQNGSTQSTDDDEGSEAPYTANQDFDVLIGSPNSAQPTIQAWGAAGSAASLEPYINAVVKN